jgi:hypothetical protein
MSTLAADNRYTGWVTNAGLNTVERSVLIRGGAGVAVKGARNPGDTAHGLRTEVSDEDAAWLATHKQFQAHQKRGFVRIMNTAQDPNKAAASMAADDGSRPMTAADVKADAEKAAAGSDLKPEETLSVTTNKKK